VKTKKYNIDGEVEADPEENSDNEGGVLSFIFFYLFLSSFFSFSSPPILPSLFLNLHSGLAKLRTVNCNISKKVNQPWTPLVNFWLKMDTS
jgi:hypothetical protein